ncbi:MAG: CPBP family intramembrane metalloprotease [Ilumatobacter sp.]|nr:CPBP family intramembrane metalloprotease [Ilumatobacter sp.]
MINHPTGRSTHRVRSAIRPSASPSPIDVRTAILTFVGAWVVAQLLTSIVLTIFGETGDPSSIPIGVLAVALAVTWSVYVASMWFASDRSGTADPIADFGIVVVPLDLLGLGIGVLAQLVVVRLVYLPLENWWPDTFTNDDLQRNAEDLVDRAGGITTLLLVAIVVIGAPVVEELFYRGLLQRSLLARINDSVVVVGVAAVFALIHFRPVEYPGLFAFGLIVGAAAKLTGRLGPSIMIHVGFNATGLFLVL